MSYQVIMRPVFNRPEMLALSLDYEIIARKYFDPGDIHTIFVVEYGAPDKILELIKTYPFSYSVIKRPIRLGLSINILEAMKTAFLFAEDHVTVIEDDVLLHETFFKYQYTALSLINEQKIDFSVLAAFTPAPRNDVNKLYYGTHYASLGQLINKKFYSQFILPHSNDNFYKHPAAYCDALNREYKDYQENKKYKYSNNMHHQQAGMINRLVDIHAIEHFKETNEYKGGTVITPFIDRIVHCGYGFSPNRPGGVLPGNSFEERLENLREIVKDPKKMFECSGKKCYNDYRAFNKDLVNWDGNLIIS